jgi:hypothetical protein
MNNNCLYRHGMCFRMSYVFVSSILFWFLQCRRYFWRVFRFLFLVTIFHICTCDDVTLVNEKFIVSWKYMKSNKKCVFNFNFQYNHKQVPTAYFSMMFNIHKHISHLIFVLVPECGEYEIGGHFLLTVFIRNRQK